MAFISIAVILDDHTTVKNTVLQADGPSAALVAQALDQAPALMVNEALSRIVFALQHVVNPRHSTEAEASEIMTASRATPDNPQTDTQPVDGAQEKIDASAPSPLSITTPTVPPVTE